MSAGQPTADRDLAKLAPRFREAVEAALRSCVAAGLDPFIFEAYRSDALQALYYTRGRPPTAEWPKPVTYARSNLFSWHGYGLAVDVVSRADGWGKPHAWFDQVAAHFQAHGCSWGGSWKQADLPHMQWGACKPSPSDRARELLASGGFRAVWEAVNAA